MNSEPDEQLACLRTLAGELDAAGLRAKLRGARTSRPHLHVTSTQSPALSEQITCRRPPGQPWQFCWSSRQPIGPAGEPGTAARVIAAVLRPVHGTGLATGNDG